LLGLLRRLLRLLPGLPLLPGLLSCGFGSEICRRLRVLLDRKSSKSGRIKSEEMIAGPEADQALEAKR
jgi:hypothetical protein